MAIGWRDAGVLVGALGLAMSGCASSGPSGESPAPGSEMDGGQEVGAQEAGVGKATLAAGSPAGPRRRPVAGGGTAPGESTAGGSALGDPALRDPDPAVGPEMPFIPDLLGAEPAGPAKQGLWSRLRDRFGIADATDDRIGAELQRYAGRQAYFDAVFGRGEPYVRHILGRIEARELPAELLLVPVIESTFRPFAYSHSRAGGIWQFTPATGRHYGLAQNWWYDGRRDVLASTEAALDYLEYLHGYFDGDWLLALAAYNAGEGRVRRAVDANAADGRPIDFWHLDLPPQTEQYVPRILALRTILSAPAEYGIELPELTADAALAVVEVDGQVDLALAAEMAGISVDELYRYNPGFNRWATPPDGPHRIALPRSRAERFRTALASRDADDMVRWRRHQVASGETLSEIASDYATSVAALRDLNDVDGSFIRAGDHLLVPSASRPAADYALSASNRRRARQSRGPAGRDRIEHRVRRGDTLWELARAHGVAVRRLASWNDMAPEDPLRPGDRLVVWVVSGGQRAGPSERLQRVRYTVRAGDSLYEIARQFGLSVADIERWNDLGGGYLQPGQELTLRVDVTAQAEAG